MDDKTMFKSYPYLASRCKRRVVECYQGDYYADAYIDKHYPTIFHLFANSNKIFSDIVRGTELIRLLEAGLKKHISLYLETDFIDDATSPCFFDVPTLLNIFLITRLLCVNNLSRVVYCRVMDHFRVILGILDDGSTDTDTVSSFEIFYARFSNSFCRDTISFSDFLSVLKTKEPFESAAFILYLFDYKDVEGHLLNKRRSLIIDVYNVYLLQVLFADFGIGLHDTCRIYSCTLLYIADNMNVDLIG